MDELIQSDVRSAELALDDLLTRRADLRRECERAVVQWRWAREGSDLQRPEPLYRERYGLPAARLLEQRRLCRRTSSSTESMPLATSSSFAST